MFFDKLMNQSGAPVLEQMLQFTAERHKLILENIASVDLPEHRQRDLSVQKFQGMLRDRIEQRDGAPAGSVGFDDIRAEIEQPRAGMLAHDGNNRSMEQLASDQAKNAMLHNMIIELLRKQFAQLDMALKDKVS